MSATAEIGMGTVLSATTIRERPRRPFQGLHGVEHTTLWSEGSSYAGLLWVKPGRHIPDHSHHQACHHVWVVEGSAVVEDRELAAGSYWYIPPGRNHGVRAGASGCQLLYLYLPAP
jgi:quercetin dioxygenase-like cupin family protein